MKDNSEETLLRRAILKLIGFVFVALAAGVLAGLALGKAIWKKPCDHPEIPVWVAYVPTNDLVQIRSNVRRIIQEMYDTPRATETWTNSGVDWMIITTNRSTNGTFQVLTNHELVITNNGTFTIHFPNFPDSKKIKWGGQATNSP